MAKPGVAARVQAIAATTIADLVSEPELLKLFDYWCGKRRGRPMPAKEDIDPIEIPWALNRIFLLDYSPDDGFRYRLAGIDIAKVFGRANLKGLTFYDIISSKGARIVEERWTTLVDGRCVIAMQGMVYYAAERTAVGERLLLPLADEPGGPVTGTFGMTVCEWVPSGEAQAMTQARLISLPVDAIPEEA